MKRTLALILSLVILFGCFELVGTTAHVEAAQSASPGTAAVFGKYFQSRVTNLSILRALRKAEEDDNGYYTVDGILYAKKDNYYYAAEPIEWIIVGEEDGCYILLSNDILANRGGVAGVNCFYSSYDLRKWLNGTFLDLAFTDEEKDDMSTGFVNFESEYPYNDPNVSPYDVELNGNLVGIKMNDYVSIPSKDDIEGNFYLEDKRATTSEYVNDDQPVSSYWLRGPALWHYGNEWAYYVTTDGTISDGAGTYAKGIRPVIKVKKNSKLLIIDYGSPSDPTSPTEPASRFSLTKDANSFAHYYGKDKNEKDKNGRTVVNSGFKGRTDYSIDKEYFIKLMGEITLIGYDVRPYTVRQMYSIKEDMDKKWKGSCYGIAMTMAKLYNGDISIDRLKDNNATNYYDIGLPCENPKLDNEIGYYHLRNGILILDLIQNIANVKKTDSYDKRKEFFTTLINYAQKDDIYILGYNYQVEKKSGGHAILIIDYWFDSAKNEHVVRLYDENSVQNNYEGKKGTGEFTTMHISEDYSSFYIEGYNNNNDLQNHIEMTIVDTNLLDLNLSSTGKDLAATGAEETCALKVNIDKPVKITNSSGKTLTVDGYDYSGDITVYDENYYGDECGVELTLSLDNDNYTVTPLSEETDCVFYNSDSYMSVSGTNIDSVDFNTVDGMDINGSDYTFDAYMSTKEEVNDYGETNLVKITGNAGSDINLSANDTSVDIKTDSAVTDVTVTNLIDNQKYSEDFGTITDDTSIPKLLLDYGDADGNGEVNIMDATLIQQHLAELTALPEKQLLASDADADDKITIVDAAVISRYIAGIIDKIGLDYLKN